MERSSRCPETRRLLPEYVEGELAPVDAGRVSAHLASCAACRQEEAGFRRSLGALAAPREMPRPGDLYPAFAVRLATEELRARRSMPMRWAAVGACVLLVVVAGAAVRLGGGPAANPTTSHGPEYVRGPIAPAPSPKVADASPAPGSRDNGSHGNGQPTVDPFSKEAERAAEAAEARASRQVAEATRQAPKGYRAQRRSVALASAAGAPRMGVPEGLIVPGVPVRVVGHGGRDDIPAVDGLATAPVAFGGAPAPAGGRVAGTRGAVMVPTIDERVQVGRNWTHVRAATGIDRQGRRIVRVDIDSAAPDPASTALGAGGTE